MTWLQSGYTDQFDVHKNSASPNWPPRVHKFHRTGVETFIVFYYLLYQASQISPFKFYSDFIPFDSVQLVFKLFALSSTKYSVGTSVNIDSKTLTENQYFLKSM